MIKEKWGGYKYGSMGSEIISGCVAEDVKDYYMDQLHKGKTGPEITKEMIQINDDLITDEDDGPIFWFALADTQWNMGRLEDFVKDQALRYIKSGEDLVRWKEENPGQAKVREKVLSDLEAKLLYPQSEEKKVKPYRLYHCEWKIGDVFAYQLESDLAVEKGVGGKHFLLQKVDEGTWYPGHTVPVVRVKITEKGKLSTSVEEFNALEYVQTWAGGKDEISSMNFARLEIGEKIAREHDDYEFDEYGFLPFYRLKLLNTSKRVIPKKLMYIGNFPNAEVPNGEFIPYLEDNLPVVSWNEFETFVIERYFQHNMREGKIYLHQ